MSPWGVFSVAVATALIIKSDKIASGDRQYIYIDHIEIEKYSSNLD